MKIYITSSLLVLFMFSGVFSQNAVSKKMAVLPLGFTDIDEELGAELTQRLMEELRSIHGLLIYSSEKVNSALSSLDSQNCRSPGCVIDAGAALAADMVLSGSISKTPDKAYLLSMTVSDVSTESVVFAKMYKCPCSITILLTTLPSRAVSDFRSTLLYPPPLETEAQASAQNTGMDEKDSEESDEMDNSGDDSDYESEHNGELDDLTGVAEKPVIGISGRWALGNLRGYDSQWGSELLIVVPTSQKSHLRFRFAIPASRSSEMSKRSDVKGPDLMYALENEWGWKHFGVVFGIAYMYMMPFNIEASYNREYRFENVNSSNWVLGIRAGRPYRGFRLRISYPMPFVSEYNSDMKDVFVEYNAFGMFGNEHFKAGCGVQGFYKNRQSHSLIGSDSIYKPEELFLMAPCGKVSFLIAEKNVMSIGLDLTGLFFPMLGEESSWAPNLTISYCYSFASLKNPELFDGKF